MRLTVARRTLLMSAKSSVSMPISKKIAYAEGQQGADQIGKIGLDPPRGLRSKGVSSNVEDSTLERGMMRLPSKQESP